MARERLLAVSLAGAMLAFGGVVFGGSTFQNPQPAKTPDTAAPVPLAHLMPAVTAAAIAAPARLDGVRYAATLSGLQMILDVTASRAVDLSVNDERSGQMTLAFAGGLSGPALQGYAKAFDTPNLRQVYVDAAGGKVQVFVKRKNPHTVDVQQSVVDAQRRRIVITVQNYASKVVHAEDLRPGLAHRRIVQYTARGPVVVNVLAVNPQSQSLEVRPVLANGQLGSRATVRSMVVGSRALAGINASFFKPDQGIPLGTVILSQELVSGPLYKRVCFGLDQNDKPHIERLDMKGAVTFRDAPTGRTLQIPVDNVNQPRVSVQQTVLYTDRWGSVAPPVPENGFQLLLQQGRLTRVSTTAPLAIPKGGLVVSGPLSETSRLLVSQASETPVEVMFYTLPDWSDMKHAVSGGPYLVQRGQLHVDARDQHFFRGLGTYEPRSAIGIQADGTVLMVTVDGRQKGHSVGVSLTELAHLMRDLGAVDAMNLDGGSSTQMVVKGELANSPSVPNGIAVATSLIIRPLGE